MLYRSGGLSALAKRARARVASTCSGCLLIQGQMGPCGPCATMKSQTQQGFPRKKTTLPTHDDGNIDGVPRRVRPTLLAFNTSYLWLFPPPTQPTTPLTAAWPRLLGWCCKEIPSATTFRRHGARYGTKNIHLVMATTANIHTRRRRPHKSPRASP